jgi:hypothetical protein
MRPALHAALLLAFLACTAHAARDTLDQVPDGTGDLDKALPSHFKQFGLAPEFGGETSPLPPPQGDKLEVDPKAAPPQEAVAVLKDEQAASHEVDLDFGTPPPLGSASIEQPAIAEAAISSSSADKPNLRGSVRPAAPQVSLVACIVQLMMCCVQVGD